uniref:Guanylate cyclase domain-containing protein n=1 Tax=Chlamydomonas leiostraca TaxID=1034604 RepID=A0A7S0RIQ3_9CHLO
MPHEQWEATGGVEVKGKGVMHTYLWVPPSCAGASAQPAPSTELAPAATTPGTTTPLSPLLQASTPPTAHPGHDESMQLGQLTCEPVTTNAAVAAVSWVEPAAGCVWLLPELPEEAPGSDGVSSGARPSKHAQQLPIVWQEAATGTTNLPAVQAVQAEGASKAVGAATLPGLPPAPIQPLPRLPVSAAAKPGSPHASVSLAAALTAASANFTAAEHPDRVPQRQASSGLLGGPVGSFWAPASCHPPAGRPARCQRQPHKRRGSHQAAAASSMVA